MGTRIILLALMMLLAMPAAFADIYMVFGASESQAYKIIESGSAPVVGQDVEATDVVLNLTTGAQNGDYEPSHYRNSGGILTHVVPQETAVSPLVQQTLGAPTGFTFDDTYGNQFVAMDWSNKGFMWYLVDDAGSDNVYAAKFSTIGAPTYYLLTGTNSQAQDIVADNEGNAWAVVTDVAGGGDTHFFKVTPSGTVTDYTYAPKSTTIAACLGQDGNVWFIDADNNVTGKVAPSGTVTTYAGATFDFLDIAAGKDGNIWITENADGKVARVSPTGTITEFVVPDDTTAQLNSLTAGGDGNIWVCDAGNNTIVRVKADGTMDSFPITTAAAGPTDIVNGPDGLWFYESNPATKLLGKIDYEGNVTETTLLANNLVFMGLVVDDHSNLWYGHYEGGPGIYEMVVRGLGTYAIGSSNFNSTNVDFSGIGDLMLPTKANDPHSTPTTTWWNSTDNELKGYDTLGTVIVQPTPPAADLDVGKMVWVDKDFANDPKWAFLDANITSTRKFLMQDGDGSFASMPTWEVIDAADLPNIDLSTGVTGVTPVPNGGTGLATISTGNLLAGNGTSALTEISPSGTAGMAVVSNGSGPGYGAVDLDASGTVTDALQPDHGGLGHTSYTKGDIPIASGTSTITKFGVGGNDWQQITSKASETNGWRLSNPGDGVVTDVAGSTSGAIHWSQTFFGNAHKKVIINLDNLTDAGVTITFSTAFSYLPAVVANTTGLTLGTLTTGSLDLPASSADDGVIILEGF